MSTLLQIAQLGHPVLRKKTKKAITISDEKIQTLINNLIATAKEVDGVGIAAPQVYQSLQIFILASYPNKRYPKAPKMKPTAIINPKIISYSKEIKKDWEGCLSIPGIRGLVPRSASVDVEYVTRTGKKVTRTYKDFVARIFQHEYDHLQGIVFLDRLETNKDIISEKEYQKQIARALKKKKRPEVQS